MDDDLEKRITEIEDALGLTYTQLIGTQVALGDLCHDLIGILGFTMERIGGMIPDDIKGLFAAETDSNSPENVGETSPDSSKNVNKNDPNSDDGNVIAITPTWHYTPNDGDWEDGA